MKELILLRGLPGSGKSTLAKLLGGKHFEADMYFVRDGEYMFDATKLKDAHEWCRSSVGGLMINEEPKLVVSNTFTQEWEMKPYYDLAERYGYKVYSLIVENRHGGVNEHGVPDEVLDKMKNRFEVKIMIDIAKLKIGDKVHYIPFEGCDESQYENGMVKEIPDHTNTSVRVVYSCAGEWDNFMNYTSALTNISQLEMDWKH